MRKLLVLLCVVTFAGLSNLSAANYKLDNAKVDVMFESASEANLSVLAQELSLDNGIPSSSVATVKGEKSVVWAAVFAYFLGGFGVHRFYLGTKVFTGIGYILTCGGIFGIVPIVDFIVILVNMKDISKYVDNSKFFMW